jgi:hypothetical protein
MVLTFYVALPEVLLKYHISFGKRELCTRNQFCMECFKAFKALVTKLEVTHYVDVTFAKFA